MLLTRDRRGRHRPRETHPVSITLIQSALWPFNTRRLVPDVTFDSADELRRRYSEFGEVSDTVLDFIDANRR
jgi:hypothetical protein